MKRILPITFFSFMFFSSCKKDRTCTCTTTTGGVTLKQTITYHKVSNKTASIDCTNQPATFIDNSGSATVSLSCKLD